MEEYKFIKVDKKIKPVHFSKRKLVELIIGDKYFVSFGRNQVHNCKLVKIEENYIEIEVPIKPLSKKRFIDVNDLISHNWIKAHIVRLDEIGKTPEEAVINQVTS